MIRVHLKVGVAIDQNNPFLVNYKLYSEVSSYSWNGPSGSGIASTGAVRFKLDSVNWNIDFEVLKAYHAKQNLV